MHFTQTIFLASLAAALLSYVNDTFSDRPSTDSSGSPIPTTKKTDDLIVLFLLLAIVTSVISTSFLIIGAIYAIFGPVKKRRPVLSTPIFALLSLGRKSNAFIPIPFFFYFILFLVSPFSASSSRPFSSFISIYCGIMDHFFTMMKKRYKRYRRSIFSLVKYNHKHHQI